MTMTRGTVSAIFAALTLLSGCNMIGIGTRVTEQDDGTYRIVTSQADDAAKENAAAARDQCPGGYSVVKKGVTAEALYGSVIRGSDLATFWDIKCTTKK